MKNILLLAFYFCSLNTIAQNTIAKKDSIIYQEEVYSFAEQMPEFIGGEDSLNSYLEKHLQYPKFEVVGNVIVNFVVNEDGSLSNVKLARGIGYGCDEEAIRLIKNMPNWKPGKQNGKSVRVLMYQPITFE